MSESTIEMLASLSRPGKYGYYIVAADYEELGSSDAENLEEYIGYRQSDNSGNEFYLLTDEAAAAVDEYWSNDD